MAQYLLKGVELLENFSFKELHRARFIKAYGVLKIIHSVKHSIMQSSFFYEGVLHKTTFINEYGVLKLTMIQKLRVVLFFFCKCMECSMAQYLQKGVELFEYFPFKELHRAFFCIDVEYLMR